MKNKIYNSALLIFTVLVMSNLNYAQRIQRADMPTARYLAASCELNGKIDVIDGDASLSSSMDIKEEIHEGNTRTTIKKTFLDMVS